MQNSVSIHLRHLDVTKYQIGQFFFRRSQTNLSVRSFQRLPAFQSDCIHYQPAHCRVILDHQDALCCDHLLNVKTLSNVARTQRRSTSWTETSAMPTLPVNQFSIRSTVIRETPDVDSDSRLITRFSAFPYTYTHKEVIDNIAFSDQEPFSSESGSWLLGVRVQDPSRSLQLHRFSLSLLESPPVRKS